MPTDPDEKLRVAPCPFCGSTNLADRLEAAGAGEERDWLIQAFYALNPAPPFGTDERGHWATLSNRFHDLIAVKAFESAAMMLVADDQRLIGIGEELWDGEPRIWTATLGQRNGRFGSPAFHAQAATPALALAAACVRASAAK